MNYFMSAKGGKKLLFATAVATIFAAAMPVFAAAPVANSLGTPPVATPPHIVTGKLPVNSGAAIACVGAAVLTRETAIDSAVSTHTSAVSAAYAARATALQQAYTGTDAAAVHTAVRTAWSTFSSAIKSAAKSWQTSRNTAWTTFRASAKACKAPATVSDSSMSYSEASGN